MTPEDKAKLQAKLHELGVKAMHLASVTGKKSWELLKWSGQKSKEAVVFSYHLAQEQMHKKSEAKAKSANPTQAAQPTQPVPPAATTSSTPPENKDNGPKP